MAPSTIDKKMLLKVLRELISIESVNPALATGGGGEKQVGRYLERLLETLGMEVVTQLVTENRFNVIGIIRGQGDGKSLLLNGHMDTVGTDGMDIDPMGAELKEGKVYGRGSEDMKGGIAAILAACEAVIRSGVKLAGDVFASFVVDEEYRSRGTEKLLTEFYADAAIVCEPTDLKIALAHKGFEWGVVEIFGKAAHGSRPREGVDAIVKAGKVLVEMERLEKSVLSRKTHPLAGSPSIHASIIEGGKEISTYPAYCKIELERRTIPGEEAGMLEGELNGIIEKIKRKDPQFHASARVSFRRPPLETSPDEPIARGLEAAFKKALDRTPQFGGASFWADSALIANAGIATVLFGPGGKGLHGAVEYVGFDSVADTAAVLAETIAAFCNSR